MEIRQLPHFLPVLKIRYFLLLSPVAAERQRVRRCLLDGQLDWSEDVEEPTDCQILATENLPSTPI